MSDSDFSSDDAIDLARRDIEMGFGDVFSAVGDGWRPVEAFFGDGNISNGRCTAVPWAYDCAHTGEFNGLPPTGDEFTIHGVTIVVSDGDEPIFHRYIDWANVMSHLGMGATWRPTLKERPES